MGHPEASTADAEVQVSASSFERPLVSPLQGHKRRVSWTPHEHPAKHRLQGHSLSSERKHELDNAIEEATRVTRVRWSDEVNVHESISGTQPVTPPISGILTGSVSFPHGQGLAYSNVRDVVEYVVKESLRIGKHFDAAVVKEVEGGQIFDIITSANGDQQKKTIEWTVDSDVPEIIWRMFSLKFKRNPSFANAFDSRREGPCEAGVVCFPERFEVHRRGPCVAEGYSVVHKFDHYDFRHRARHSGVIPTEHLQTVFQGRRDDYKTQRRTWSWSSSCKGSIAKAQGRLDLDPLQHGRY